jgi:hypothetical protein
VIFAILLSNDQNETQEMLNTVYDYSSDNRFLIHPIKSITIVKVSTSEIQKEYRRGTT